MSNNLQNRSVGVGNIMLPLVLYGANRWPYPERGIIVIRKYLFFTVRIFKHAVFNYPLNCECTFPSQLKKVHVTLSFSTSNSVGNTVHLSWTGLQFGFTPQLPLKSLTITKSQIVGRIQIYLCFLTIQGVPGLPKIAAWEQDACREIIRQPSWINSDLIKSDLIWSNLISCLSNQ